MYKIQKHFDPENENFILLFNKMNFEDHLDAFLFDELLPEIHNTEKKTENVILEKDLDELQISGPVDLRKIDFTFNKKISRNIFFGDVHESDKGICKEDSGMNLNLFINSLFKNNPNTIIRFYIEGDLISSHQNKFNAIYQTKIFFFKHASLCIIPHRSPLQVPNFLNSFKEKGKINLGDFVNEFINKIHNLFTLPCSQLSCNIFKFQLLCARHFQIQNDIFEYEIFKLNTTRESETRTKETVPIEIIKKDISYLKNYEIVVKDVDKLKHCFKKTFTRDPILCLYKEFFLDAQIVKNEGDLNYDVEIHIPEVVANHNLVNEFLKVLSKYAHNVRIKNLLFSLKRKNTGDLELSEDNTILIPIKGFYKFQFNQNVIHDEFTFKGIFLFSDKITRKLELFHTAIETLETLNSSKEKQILWFFTSRYYNHEHDYDNDTSTLKINDIFNPPSVNPQAHSNYKKDLQSSIILADNRESLKHAILFKEDLAKVNLDNKYKNPNSEEWTINLDVSVHDIRNSLLQLRKARKKKKGHEYRFQSEMLDQARVFLAMLGVVDFKNKFMFEKKSISDFDKHIKHAWINFILNQIDDNNFLHVDINLFKKFIKFKVDQTDFKLFFTKLKKYFNLKKKIDEDDAAAAAAAAAADEETETEVEDEEDVITESDDDDEVGKGDADIESDDDVGLYKYYELTQKNYKKEKVKEVQKLNSTVNICFYLVLLFYFDLVYSTYMEMNYIHYIPFEGIEDVENKEIHDNLLKEFQELKKNKTIRDNIEYNIFYLGRAHVNNIINFVTKSEKGNLYDITEKFKKQPSRCVKLSLDMKTFQFSKLSTLFEKQNENQSEDRESLKLLYD